jgi:hypothetical protein
MLGRQRSSSCVVAALPVLPVLLKRRAEPAHPAVAVMQVDMMVSPRQAHLQHPPGQLELVLLLLLLLLLVLLLRGVLGWLLCKLSCLSSYRLGSRLNAATTATLLSSSSCSLCSASASAAGRRGIIQNNQVFCVTATGAYIYNLQEHAAVAVCRIIR